MSFIRFARALTIFWMICIDFVFETDANTHYSIARLFIYCRPCFFFSLSLLVVDLFVNSFLIDSLVLHQIWSVCAVPLYTYMQRCLNICIWHWIHRCACVNVESRMLQMQMRIHIDTPNIILQMHSAIESTAINLNFIPLNRYICTCLLYFYDFFFFFFSIEIKL